MLAPVPPRTGWNGPFWELGFQRIVFELSLAGDTVAVSLGGDDVIEPDGAGAHSPDVRRKSVVKTRRRRAMSQVGMLSDYSGRVHTSFFASRKRLYTGAARAY
jgi:hypothetical protein